MLKPAEYTPLTALALANICREAGLPAGVLNIVTGDGETGAAIVDHLGIDKIAFTGSAEVGRVIRRKTAGAGKKLTLEPGGKSPFVVFADADLDAAVEGVVDAIWLNGGQVCCAGLRILVQEGVAERFTKPLTRRMETLRTGAPLDNSADIGAIVHPVQLRRIEALVAQGEKEGARGTGPGGKARAASSCAARRRSRISGCPTASDRVADCPKKRVSADPNELKQGMNDGLEASGIADKAIGLANVAVPAFGVVRPTAPVLRHG